MGDLKDPRLMWLKAALFVVAVLLASAGLLAQQPEWRTALLLAIAVVCACRFYYFCFYVIEHYIDDQFRFAGLWSVLLYLWRRRSG
ncbi:MAG: hypothetical protein HZB16_08045 [Armatimonadetes bacterium]|nr:hypothetical protein [Armatimonadota bacterium]